MKNFYHTELWKIIRNSETATGCTVEPAAALDEFVAELHDYCRKEKDLAELTRTLRFARSELATAQERIYTGAGKKCAVAGYCHPVH